MSVSHVDVASFGADDRDVLNRLAVGSNPVLVVLRVPDFERLVGHHRADEPCESGPVILMKKRGLDVEGDPAARFDHLVGVGECFGGDVAKAERRNASQAVESVSRKLTLIKILTCSLILFGFITGNYNF